MVKIKGQTNISYVTSDRSYHRGVVLVSGFDLEVGTSNEFIEPGL